MEKLLSNLTSLLSGGTKQQENTYSYVSKWQVRSKKAKKKTSININQATTGVHLLKSVSVDLIIQIYLSPEKKRWSARLIDATKRLTHKVFYSDTTTRSVANHG